jgi:hypothetical protein
MKYRKRPLIIDAIKFSISDISTHEHINFGIPKEANDFTSHPLDNKYWIQTLEGLLFVSEGDYIITGIKGEVYPCKPDIFEASYEMVV